MSIKKVQILFMIDISQSMDKCIISLCNMLDGFTSELIRENIDVEFGLLGYDRKQFYELDFTNNLIKIKNSMQTLVHLTQNGADEFTLPALDYALDFNWTSPRKIIAIFTDECLAGGWDTPFQLSKQNELNDKIASLEISINFFGKRCQDYISIFFESPNAPPNTNYFDVIKKGEKNFEKVNFNEIKNLLVKSSMMVRAQEKPQAAHKDIYKIHNKIRIHQL